MKKHIETNSITKEETKLYMLNANIVDHEDECFYGLMYDPEDEVPKNCCSCDPKHIREFLKEFKQTCEENDRKYNGNKQPR